MTQHSILAPSGAVTWARCVGAPHLSRDLPDIDAEYKASGTCSHWILEQALKEGTPPASWIGKTLKFGAFEFKIDAERAERVQSVVTALAREPGQMWSEKELNTSPVLGVPDQIGHADVMKLDPLGVVEVNGQQIQGVLSIHDFKDGYLKVMARDNLQGLIYAAAALYEVDLIAPIGAIRFCIHQPVIGHYDEWSYTRAEIEAFIAAIRPVARLAYDIYHGRVPFDPELHLTPGEEQCFWCPARGSCPARARRIIAMFGTMITNHVIDDATLGTLYARLDEIEHACRDYRGEALKRALGGRVIEGYKLVRGKRGKRAWKDEARAESDLAFLLPQDKIYQPKAVISPTQADNLLSDEQYAVLKDNIRQNEGSYSLAPLSDPREAVAIQQFPVIDQSGANHDLL